MPVAGGPKITKTGILLDVDAADKQSYPGTGTTWINPITPGTFNGTLNNISFDSNDSRGALVFTGSNTFVDFGNLGPSLTSSFSFQVAFKPAATASGQPYTILSYASASATSSITFKLDYTSSNQTVILSSFSNTGSQNIVYSISGSVTPGTWNIINGTYGSNVLALFKNGNLITSVPTTGSTVGYNASNRLYLGGTFGSTAGFFTGSIANLIINRDDLDIRVIASNYNAFFSRFGLTKTPGLVTDFDVINFIENTGLSNETQILAINSLVLGLKSNNLWTKMQAIYPFVGGTAYTHKVNLKDPRDLDAAYRILWSGAIIHSDKGVAFNGSSFGNTNFAPFTALADPLQSNHLSIYTSGSISSFNLTAAGNTNFIENGIGIAINYQNRMNAYSPSAFGISTDGQNGLFAVTRTDSSNSAAYIRGSVTRTSTSTTSPTASPRTGNIFIGKENGAWGGTPTNTLFSFSSIGTGLTTPDVENLYTVVQAFNTSLNRAFNQ
jgi:hypothetical protein